MGEMRTAVAETNQDRQTFATQTQELNGLKTEIRRLRDDLQTLHGYRDRYDTAHARCEQLEREQRAALDALAASRNTINATRDAHYQTQNNLREVTRNEQRLNQERRRLRATFLEAQEALQAREEEVRIKQERLQEVQDRYDFINQQFLNLAAGGDDSDD